MKYNKTIMITGAGRGIAHEIAMEAAVQYDRLFLIDIDAAGLEKTRAEIKEIAPETKVVIAAVDITKKEALAEKVAAAKQELGAIDVLVNVAGVSPECPLEEITEEAWDFVMGVNLKGTFFCIQDVIADMVAKGAGSIVNFSSMAGVDGTANAGAYYSASKAGVIGLTKYVSKVYASKGIRCNAIAPGPVRTEMTSKTQKETLENLYNSMPMHRLAETSEIAKAALFLAGEDASFVTGTVFEVSGGQIIV